MIYNDNILTESDIDVYKALEENKMVKAIETLESHGIPMLDMCISLYEQYGFVLENDDDDDLPQVTTGSKKNANEIKQRLLAEIKSIKRDRNETRAMGFVSWLTGLLSVGAIGNSVRLSIMYAGDPALNEAVSNNLIMAGLSAACSCITMAATKYSQKHETKYANDIVIWIGKQIELLEDNIRNGRGNIRAQKMVKDQLEKSLYKIRA